MSALPAEPESDMAGLGRGRDLDVRDYLFGIGAAYAGLANVVMQLSMPGVGYGVVDGAVESGSAMAHPIKRARTTFTYLAVALTGDERDRKAMREAVNRQHAQVRSGPDAPVPYNAFDRDLQLWVAACLSYGTLDLVRALAGPLTEAELDFLYHETARFGTTLQVPPERWPATRTDFEAYWRRSLEQISLAPHVRRYLLALLDQRNMPLLLRVTAGRFVRFMNVGFLPPEFRALLGEAWTPAQQRRFELVLRWTGRLYRPLPRWARWFPFNLLLRDLRLRARTNRPIV